MHAVSDTSESIQQATPARRKFFRWATGLLSAAAGVLAAVPVLRYFVGQQKQNELWVDLGAVAGFPAEETRLVSFDNPLRQPWDGETSETSVYVRRQTSGDAAPQFLVFAVNCAHLGCPVSWFPQSGLFLCPCHGGVYYADGQRASGPPPRGLFHCQWRVRDDKLEIVAPHYPSLQDTLDKHA